AAARAENVLPKGFEVLERKLGRELAGMKYEALYVAVGERLVPLPGCDPNDSTRMHTVIARPFVTTSDGTGIVHQAPYGADDWESAKELRVCPVLGPSFDGRFKAPVVRHGAERDAVVVAIGTWFKDADELVVADLKARHLLFRSAHESHSYPHCWRCSTPLFY